ncbi:choline ABC transporter ATP-binding protein [Sneathiella glossodoripedis]|uniref:choline ABC transporter ATP-binding protein n=1 Tax=Sneathiella glossodoripedis TaxID=418853 RepID=UPI0005609832|nr:choline ABC transporter ATP-binding protein [Sneathiella glossodoripedis]
MNSAISFKSVSVIFGEQPEAALQLAKEGKSREEIQEQTSNVLGVTECTLDVEIGEIVVLMGLSGSGKSTLLRTVNGLNPITAGDVTVCAGSETVSLGSASKKQLHHLRSHLVAMVFQSFALLPWRTVAENVGLGLELSKVGKLEREERIGHHLDLVGLTEWADRKITELSGGMRQRVGLARAFVTEAPILLMDEPFSALDPLIRARLQDELLELQQKSKRTILFVSHDLDEAMKIGNRIAIMKGGRINQFGSPQDIVLNPADQYVKDFVAHMNPLNILCAEDVMRSELQTDSALMRQVPPHMAVRDVIALMNEDQSPLRVIADGAQIGVISQDDILQALGR